MASSVFSPAKINFSLLIGPKRADGFHSLQSLVLPLKDLGDTLTFYPAKGLKVTASLGESLRDKSKNFPLPSEKENLIWKAATLFFEKSNIKPSIHIDLKKKTPFGS